MDERMLRGKVEKAVGGLVPQNVWDHFKHGEFNAIQGVLSSWENVKTVGDEESNLNFESDFKHLCEDIERITALVVEGPQYTTRQGTTAERDTVRDTVESEVNFIPPLSAYEYKRALCFSKTLCRYATTDEDVRSFRDALVGDTLLTREQAFVFFRSPLTRFMQSAWFIDHAVRPLDFRLTRARPKHVEDVDGVHVQIRIETDPATELSGVTHEWHGRDWGDVKYADVPSTKDWEDWYFDWHEQDYWPGSVMSDLNNLGKRLAGRYPWTYRQAVWFAVTGIAPFVTPLLSRSITRGGEGYSYGYGKITIEAEPWMSPDTVAKTFTALRRDMLGRHPKQREMRPLDVFDFVTDRRPTGRVNGWPELCDEWNRSRPRQEAFRTYKGMRQAYLRAHNEVMYSVDSVD